MIRLLICLGFAVTALPAPARAEFGDCMDEAYLSRFIEATTAPGMACVEEFRFSYPTPEGPREIRAISDAAVD